MRETEDNQTEQKEHLSLNNTGYNNVLNATNFLQKRWVWINILTKIKYSCDKCGKQFTELGSMKKHIQSAHEGVMFPCDQYYYQATQDFWKIWWICPKYHCDHCGKKSIHKVILKHIFSLFMKVFSILVICVIIKIQEWVVFRNIFTLNMKVSSILVINVINNLQGMVISRNIFSINMKVLSLCDKDLTNKDHLNRHIKSFHEEAKYRCYQCDKQYTHRSDLKRHIDSLHKKK